MRHLIATLLLSVACIATACASLTTQLNSLITKHLSNSTVGMMVVNGKTGKVLYHRNAYHYFTPASNTKLFTAAAALLYLGPSFTFNTSISRAGNNVYLNFSGDPTFTSQDLFNLIAALKQHGITAIPGDVILDDTVFSGPKYALGWPHDDLPYCFAAPVTGIIIDQNCMPVKILNTPGQPTRVKFLTSVNIPITADINFANAEQLKTCVFDPETHDNNRITLSGCLPDRQEWSFNFAITNPTLYATQLIRADLQANGIRLTGDIVTGSTPANVHMIANHASAPLYQIIGTMLKYSDNLYANAIAKTLGNRYYEVGSYKAGVSAIDAILQARLGKNFTPPYLEGGAGESIYNLISPHETIELLTYMQHNKLWSFFRNALAISGQAGTLQDRMAKPPLQNRIFAKTGSMSGVSNLSGYVLLPKHTPMLFAIYMNGIRGSLKPARKLQDQMVALIAKAS